MGYTPMKSDFYWNFSLENIGPVPIILTQPLYIYYIRIRTHDTGFWTNFHEIHMIGAGPLTGEPYYFLETISPIEPQILGEMCPQKSFLGLSPMVWGFSRKKLKNCNRYPISSIKGYIHFCRPTPLPSKMVMPAKNNFSLLFRKNC